MQPVRLATERILVRAVIAVITVFVIVWAVPTLFHLLSPFIIAIPIAAMLQPMIRFAQKRLKVKRGLASFVLVLLVCALAITLVYLFVSFSIGQVINAINNAPAIVTSITDTLRAVMDKLLSAAENLPDVVSEAIRSSLDETIKSLSTTITHFSGDLLGYMVSVATGLPYMLVYANFLIMALFFISTKYDDFSQRFRRQQSDDENVMLMRKTAVKGILGYIRVQLLFAVGHMVFAWVALQAFSTPYAVLFAIAAALLEMIPLFGCGVLYVPWAIVSFIIGNSYTGWVALALYMLWSLGRRLFEPKLLSSNIGISPLMSLLGMFVGMRLGGVWGLILGPIAMLLWEAARQAKLFDGLARDIKTVALALKTRWAQRPPVKK